MDRYKAVERQAGGASPWPGSTANGAEASSETLPSRLRAMEATRDAIREGEGLVLLTGDAGVGKTWMHRRLRDAMPSCWQWIEIDLSPAVGPLEFHQLIGHALGLKAPRNVAEARVRTAGRLAEGAANQERCCLVVEEAQNAGAEVLEEIRVLSNRLGEPDGFSGVVVVVQSGLTGRPNGRPLAPLSDRVRARVHLRPLDVDEFARWLMTREPGLALDPLEIEHLHRMVGGNPRRFLRDVRPKTGAAPKTSPAATRRPDESPGASTSPSPAEARPSRAASPLAPPAEWGNFASPTPRPPLQVADDMIEVGWDASQEPGEPSGGGSSLDPEAGKLGEGLDRGARSSEGFALPSVEMIDDRYAALQAWNEWARNQGRAPGTEPISNEALDVPEGEGEGEGVDDDENSSRLRAEGQHAFAPYSQLFSRLHEARESS